MSGWDFCNGNKERVRPAAGGHPLSYSGPSGPFYQFLIIANLLGFLVKKLFLLRSCALFAMPLAAIPILLHPAMAQQITTEINGQVTDAAGAPLANATVTITDTRTGATQHITTNDQGLFAARNLSTGGPYTRHRDRARLPGPDGRATSPPPCRAPPS